MSNHDETIAHKLASTLVIEKPHKTILRGNKYSAKTGSNKQRHKRWIKCVKEMLQKTIGYNDTDPNRQLVVLSINLLAPWESVFV